MGLFKKAKDKKLVLSEKEQTLFDQERDKMRTELLKDMAKRKAKEELTPKQGERLGTSLAKNAVKTTGKTLDWIAGRDNKIDVECSACGARGKRFGKADLKKNNKCRKCDGTLLA